MVRGTPIQNKTKKSIAFSSFLQLHTHQISGLSLEFPKLMEHLILHSRYKCNTRIKYRANIINSICLSCSITDSKANISKEQPAPTSGRSASWSKEKLASNQGLSSQCPHFPLINQLYTKHIHLFLWHERKGA